jgi:hypothetical protein
MRRFLLILSLPLFLAACAAEPVWAPDELVSRSIYRQEGPSEITLYSVLNVGSDNGAHSGLMINASQRVIFDPAGTFAHETIPERNDVIFGVNPQILNYYLDYHARSSYYIVSQTVQVSPEVAEAALQLVMQHGAVGKAQCSRSISSILSNLPGFESLSPVWFPDRLMRDFQELPGVTRSEIYDTDGDDNSGVLNEIPG